VSEPDAAPGASRVLAGGHVLADPLVRELLGKRLVGVLATLDGDGSPHVVPIWFAPRAADVLLATSSHSRKVRNLERDPRATLCVHDSRPGSEVCGASIRGHVDIVPSSAAAELVELVHRRYLSVAAAVLPEVADFVASDDVALVLRPERAWTWDERENPATEALRRVGGALPLEPSTPAS
jgi:PPOX class probable F420-dependent enzyme